MSGGPERERLRVAAAYRAYAARGRTKRRWSGENAGNIAIREELVGAVEELAGGRLRAARAILDAGCGMGWWLARLAQRPEISAALFGLEILPERASAARERVPTASVAEGDLRRLPYRDARFDIVTLFTVLTSLADRPDLDLALREVHRVLVPGGVVFVWEPRVPNPLNRRTLLITSRMLQQAWPGTTESRSITVVPALARRLGRWTAAWYPRLARAGVLRTHRVWMLVRD